jgi:hypothetical protein
LGTGSDFGGGGGVDGWGLKAERVRVVGAYDVAKDGAVGMAVPAREEGFRRRGVMFCDRSAEAGWRAAQWY